MAKGITISPRRLVRQVTQLVFFLYVVGSAHIFLSFLVDDFRDMLGVFGVSGRYSLAVFVIQRWFPAGIIISSIQFVNFIGYVERLRTRIKFLREQSVTLQSKIYGYETKKDGEAGAPFQAIDEKEEENVGLLSMARVEFQESGQVFSDFLTMENLEKVKESAEVIADSLSGGGKVLSCGNGGSHSDACHFAEELSGRFRENRPGLAALSISDSAYLTCVANDFGYEHVFSRFVGTFGKRGDVLFALSTSGGSENIARAFEEAKRRGMKIVFLTGNDGGPLQGKADVELRVPHEGYADRVQEVHIKIIHVVVFLVEKLLSSDSRN